MTTEIIYPVGYISPTVIAVKVVQAYMDSFAREKDYDDIKSAALRAGYAGPFQAEGIKYAQWMDACWNTCYSVQAEIIAGTIEIPTEEELIGMLPAKPTFP